MIEAVKILGWATAGFIGTALVIAATSPAHAQTYDQPLTVLAKHDPLTRVVPYGDLSLANKQGRRSLYHRVARAVGQVCPPYDAVFDSYDAAACEDFAWDGARPQISLAIARAESGDASFAMSAITISAPK